MVPTRVFAFAILATSVAASAQQTAPAPQPVASLQKPSDADKPICHVTKEGNSLKRLCMTKEQWRKAEAETNQDVDETGLRNGRCPQGAC